MCALLYNDQSLETWSLSRELLFEWRPMERTEALGARVVKLGSFKKGVWRMEGGMGRSGQKGLLEGSGWVSAYLVQISSGPGMVRHGGCID